MPGVNVTQTENESPIRVVITPSQSSFFAGEQFSVTITFTNTRTPEAGPSKPAEQAHSQTRTHKRGVHSISSAPLARPPTSPGTPRHAVNSPRKLGGFEDDALPGRKGLVGTAKMGYHDGQLPELLEQRRKKLLAKSLSISISSQELDEQFGEGIIAATPASAPFNKQTFKDTNQSPTSVNVPSPLSRTDTLPLSSDHPHARKQSILDGQFSLDILSPTTSIPPQPYTPTTSLSLSTISETSFSGNPSTHSLPTTTTTTPRTSSPLSPTYSQPAFHPNNSSNSNTVQAYPSFTASSAAPAAGATPRPHHNRRFSQQIQIGLGQPSNVARNQTQPRTAFSSTFPQANTEVVLYSYAQLVGTVHVIPEGAGGATPTHDQAFRMNRIRRALVRKRAVVGGGSMDISQSLHSGSSIASSISGGSQLPRHQPTQGPGYPRRRPGHGRSISFSASLMSLLSPAAGPTPTAMGERAITTSPDHLNGDAASASGLKPINGPGPGGGGLGLGILSSPTLGSGVLEESVDPELPLPTFEAQPSMLAVDLSLPPGESRSYTYTIKLPDVLPPTYKGRALIFSYELVVGTCRAGSSAPNPKQSSGTAGTNSISRVMKVPIRVYNHVTVGRPPRPYDILWPVLHDRLSGLGKGKEREIPEAQGKVVEETGAMVAKLKKTAHLPSPKSGGEGSLEELRQYTKRLIASLPPIVNGNGFDVSTPGIEGKTASSLSASLPTTDSDAMKNVGLRVSLDEAREQEEEEDRAMAGCREAVEILTRLPKKASYDVNKDGVKVAVLTFTKSAYRLGETVSGIVELNDRVGRARVLQLCAILEAHETLPTSVAPLISARNLKRAYAEHHASFTLNTLRTTFALDIPSDASPAFQVRVNDSDCVEPSSTSLPTSLGGLEWKVRLCLLVAIASESSDCGTEGVYFKNLERDGPRGEWGSSWRAPKSLAPLEKPRLGLDHLRKESEKARTKSWTQLFVDSVWTTIGGVAAGGYEREHHDGDESDAESGTGEERDYDGIKPNFAGGVGKGVDYAGGEEGWKEVRLETVECEVPIKVWPGNTAFRAVDVVFDV
ncbi:Rgp1-domain-containing protein [Macrolepiota fuliginosa MF-IS2]|uniref:Rgp1-domain-containing protein n=1 Tax=Macrolepiota fuliginosa MF-IS2 TaxID=1400762 RepID=A0A9P5XFK6_9AGAR|nr:Rgp1-domain-containing protein [Macrolepiota fuliginosa MF-IS2]